MENAAETQTPNPAPEAPAPVEAVSEQPVGADKAEVTSPPVEAQPVSIPEKFKGKSFEDVAGAYSEVEKEKSRLANEVGELRKKLLEASEKAAPPPAAVEPSIDQVREKTPEEIYDEEFVTIGPKEAIKNLDINRRKQQQRQQEIAISHQIVESAAAGKVQGWEDFPTLLPDIQAVAQEIAPMIHPDFRNNPKLIGYAGLIARGLQASRKAAEAAQEAAKSATAAAVGKDLAKEKAFMESGSGSSAEGTVPFANLSFEERQRLLPRHQR